jgi:hypothetical protein
MGLAKDAALMKLGPAQAGGNVLIFKLGEPFGWKCPRGAKGRATRRTRVGWRIPGADLPYRRNLWEVLHDLRAVAF